MSVIRNGKFIRSELAKNANGGTEYMSDTLVRCVAVPNDVVIHVSRFEARNWVDGERNILYVHDLPEDPMYDGVDFTKFWRVVFVSAHQYARFSTRRFLDHSKCVVIPNCVAEGLKFRSRTIDVEDRVRFIYHTTPHRGLEELVDGFDRIRDVIPRATLDVYSSFNAYGWGERDEFFKNTFEKIASKPYMTLHGFQPREVVYEALNEADVFFYPSKWEETSCIAMIEAARSGLLCIANDFGALRETMNGYRNCVLYRASDVGTRYDALISTINKQVIQANRPIVTEISSGTNHWHTLEGFAKAWEKLLVTQ